MQRSGRLVAVVLALVCVAASATAQSTGDVFGSIADQTGARLPGVRLTIRGNVDRTTETGPGGDFTFTGLPPGDYEIAAELIGFERSSRRMRTAA